MSFAHAHARALESRPSSGFFARVVPADAADGPASSHVFVAIEIPGKVRIAGRLVDAGTYRVRLDESRERIVLESGERTHVLTAFFRRAKGRSSGPIEASLELATDARAMIVVRLASGGEWVA